MRREGLPPVIAIDGPAASGKSSLGAALAARLGYLLFDTGITYRGFTVVALERGIPASDGPACEQLARALEIQILGERESRIVIDGVDVTPRLREPAVEAGVSAYSAIPGVREVMVAKQREVAARGGVVVVGRDIGTVVLPGAPVKLYLEASSEVRARRRSSQAATWGMRQDPGEAARDIEGRDAVDTSRATSPLRAAPDAVVIDTTDLALEEVVAKAWEVIACSRG